MGESRREQNNSNQDRTSSVSQNQNQPEQQQPHTHTQTENNDIAEQSAAPVAKSTGVTVSIKALEAAGGIAGLIAGILATFTSHHLLTSVLLFVSITTMASGCYLYWWQNLQKGYRYKTHLIAITFLVTLALTIFLCWKINGLFATEAAAKKPETSPVNPSAAFIIKQHGSMFFPVFPQPLLYVYSSSPYVSGDLSDKLIAPVGLAINLEVLNGRNTPTKVRSYVADLEMENGSWARIFSLPTQQPHHLYFDDSLDLKNCVELEFTPNLFDVVASQKSLMPGESLNGWVFFEWSPELKGNKKIHKVRIKVENLQNEGAEAVFDLLSTESEQGTGGYGRGTSLLNEGRFRRKFSDKPPEDLSSLPIRPFRSE